jgi:hypothetical protein
MLRLTIEIVPFGVLPPHHIHTLEISRRSLNRNPETYDVCSYAQDGELTGRFTVKDHWRDDGADELCRRALEVFCGADT